MFEKKAEIPTYVKDWRNMKVYLAKVCTVKVFGLHSWAKREVSNDALHCTVRTLNENEKLETKG